jgi:hypothetical protein
MEQIMRHHSQLIRVETAIISSAKANYCWIWIIYILCRLTNPWNKLSGKKVNLFPFRQLKKFTDDWSILTAKKPTSSVDWQVQGTDYVAQQSIYFLPSHCKNSLKKKQLMLVWIFYIFWRFTCPWNMSVSTLSIFLSYPLNWLPLIYSLTLHCLIVLLKKGIDDDVSIKKNKLYLWR